MDFRSIFLAIHSLQFFSYLSSCLVYQIFPLLLPSYLYVFHHLWWFLFFSHSILKTNSSFVTSPFPSFCHLVLLLLFSLRFVLYFLLFVFSYRFLNLFSKNSLFSSPGIFFSATFHILLLPTFVQLSRCSVFLALIHFIVNLIQKHSQPWKCKYIFPESNVVRNSWIKIQPYQTLWFL